MVITIGVPVTVMITALREPIVMATMETEEEEQRQHHWVHHHLEITGRLKEVPEEEEGVGELQGVDIHHLVGVAFPGQPVMITGVTQAPNRLTSPQLRLGQAINGRHH